MNRVICLFVCGCLIAGSLPSPPVAVAQNIGTQSADLHQQLKSVLKARRPEEFAFIAKVVAKVEDKSLPLDVVMSTFLWTRKNPKAKQYPFVYFQAALLVRLEKLGIPF